MSRWHGRMGRGAMRQVRLEKRQEAERRNERYQKTITVEFDHDLGLWKAEMPSAPGTLGLGSTSELAVQEFRRTLKMLQSAEVQ